MDIKKLEKASELETFSGYIAELAQAHDHGHGHGHGGDGSIETIRQDDYEGHHIEIRTTYRIEVDGKTLLAPLGVDNDGNLHCHSLPNYQTSSAVDMIRRLIDNFPDDFKSKKGSKKTPAKSGSKKAPTGHSHGAHKHAAKGGK